jgi:lipid-binding SYLF domain-containing protein
MSRISLPLGLGVLLALTATAVRADEASRLAEAAKVVQEVRTDIPTDYWDKARCVAVIPDLKKAAFIFGGEYGKGVMSCRAGETWSAPLFMQLAKGSWGFQAGAENVDLVLLVMNESGVQKLLRNKVNLGADASVAAGPVGRRGGAATDAVLDAEILTYARSKGLFAGIDISGGVLRPDEDANESIYGASATASTILASRDISAPTQATPFIQALGVAAPAAAASTSADAAARAPQSSPPERRDTATPATDDDVRAQLVDIQQTIDRLLADSTPAAVGTSGTTTGDRAATGTVTVDRARLLQMRQQIDSVLAALRRR